MSKKVIGIDLGTGNSCVSVIENGKAVVVANSEGCRTTPSVVSLKDSERKVGNSANRQRVVFPTETIINIKRFMGSDYEKSKSIIDKMPYKVINKNGVPRVVVDEREYSPEEISSYILNKMKKTAEDYLGETVTDAVITCPAWFDSNAREATKLAGEMCGLNVLRVINEPTAAILASSIETNGKDIRVLVADIGQGTTDFSVCEISDGLVEVLASKGDVFLGGSDFDNAIADYIIDNFNKENDVDLRKDKQALQRILESSEKAKIELSSSTSTEINLPYITVNNNVPIHLNITLTRAKMEQLTEFLVEKIINCGKNAMKEAKINNNDLDCILLVGGQSRSLAIQKALSDTFGATLNKSVNPDEAVSMGAAIQANIIVGGEGANDILLLDVTPLTLGIETMGGVMTPIVEANTTVPCRKSQIFTTATDNQPSVTINVLQGERPKASDNKQIGVFNLDGIAPARRGIPQIEVTFDIDANGILSVSAKDKATGKEQTVRIESKNSLNSEEIERIKQEAKEHEEEDKKTREKMEKRNRCESLIYQTEQTMENYKNNEHFTNDDKNFFDEKISILKEMSKNEDYSKLEEITNEIMLRWNNITSKLYENNQGNGQSNDLFNQFNDYFGGNGFKTNGNNCNNENCEFQDMK